MIPAFGYANSSMPDGGILALESTLNIGGFPHVPALTRFLQNNMIV